MRKVMIMLMLAVGVGSAGAEQVPVEVQRFIDSAMAGKAHGVAAFDLNAEGIGLEKGTKLADLKAGEPFRLYSFTYDSVQKYDENMKVSSAIKPMNKWAVPLLEHGKSKALLLISYYSQDKKWGVGGYGFSGYALVWEKIRKVWPESVGFHPIYIGNLEGPSYFHIPENGDKNLSPFFHYGALKDNPDSLYASLDSSNITLRKIKSMMNAPYRKRGQ